MWTCRCILYARRALHNSITPIFNRKNRTMYRILAIFMLALLISASEASAQKPEDAKQTDPAKQYSLSHIRETPVQQRRRVQQETAQHLVFQRAAHRATLREQRIATASALGISHARPNMQQQAWLSNYWWTLPRIIYLYVNAPEADTTSSATRY